MWSSERAPLDLVSQRKDNGEQATRDGQLLQVAYTAGNSRIVTLTEIILGGVTKTQKEPRCPVYSPSVRC